ncbi:MAG: single-stranded-DNA-specific exonuclease RecJ [Spirosomataceae bacterium]
MTEKNWKLKPIPQTEKDKQLVLSLIKDIHVSPTTAQLLWQRSIVDFDDAKRFFRPSLEHLHDPFLMADMDKAVDRLQKALDTQEKILIYGDYDVDGTTAVALMYGFLKKLTTQIDHYNPDRYTEGYGVSTQGIDFAKSWGATLIIALDCGIKSIDKVEYANSLGIDFIICDHHEPGEELPQAVAVLDPKRKDCLYPFKELTGNGVGFKLLQALSGRQGIPEGVLLEFIDLCVVSIGSDIVPIVGENRTLAYFGLKKLNEKPCIGLQALKEVAGFTTSMTIENVVFVLGPRINAAGRIKHAKAAVQLLLSDNLIEAKEFAIEINAQNTQRKDFDSTITEEAIELIESDPWLREEAKSTVLYNKDWHKGVIGIVASRCIEKYYRPTIILTHSNGKAAGSARSVAGFDLYSAIEACSEHLEQFGGHTHAAGMTMPIENIPAFQKAFDRVVSEKILPEQLIPQIDVDLVVRLADITPQFYKVMQQMAPFGPQNMQPVFQTNGLTLVGNPIVMKEKHLKIHVTEPNLSTSFTAIGFGMVGDFYTRLVATKKPFSIVYTLAENTWNGQTTLQLMLRDIKIADN